MDNSGVIAGRGVVEVEEGKGGNKRWWTETWLGVVNTQYTDDVL